MARHKTTPTAVAAITNNQHWCCWWLWWWWFCPFGRGWCNNKITRRVFLPFSLNVIITFINQVINGDHYISEFSNNSFFKPEYFLWTCNKPNYDKWLMCVLKKTFKLQTPSNDVKQGRNGLLWKDWQGLTLWKIIYLPIRRSYRQVDFFTLYIYIYITRLPARLVDVWVIWVIRLILNMALFSYCKHTHR